MRVICKRLKPQEELFASLEKLTLEENIEAGTLISVVGSLSRATIRYADKSEPTTLDGPFEIVSGTGVVAISGQHLHLSLSDSEGATIGGHSMPGNFVHTTIELVILDLSKQYTFKREPCPLSGYDELSVVARCQAE